MADQTRYLITPTAGLVIPGGQAAVTGLSAGVVAGSLARLRGVPDPLTVGVLVGAFVGGAAWLHGVAWWRAAVAPQQQMPITPATYHQTTRVELVQNAGSPYLAVDWIELPVPQDAMIAASIELLTRGFVTSNLGGAKKALTRSEAEALRDFLIAHGLAAWKRSGSPTLGWDLNGAGRSLVRRFAGLASPTLADYALPDGRRLTPGG